MNPLGQGILGRDCDFCRAPATRWVRPEAEEDDIMKRKVPACDTCASWDQSRRETPGDGTDGMRRGFLS